MDSNLFQGLFHENARTAPQQLKPLTCNIGSFLCENGQTIPGVEVAYETWGTLSEAKDNAILVCHALSGDSHCVGWWDKIVGPAKPIDTEKFFVIGQNVIGGCQGTTGPSSVAADHQPYGSRFPHISVGDMVEVQACLVLALGINKLWAVAGGSMGGMQAIEWAVRFPDRVAKVFATATAASHSPMQIGFNEAGRQAIMRDPAWMGGDYGEAGPHGGLAVARMMAHLTFLSEASFEQKFGRRLQEPSDAKNTFGAEFEVESYLRHQGEKFTQRFDANSLLVLTKAIDVYECSSLKNATAEFLFASYSSDWLYPPHQSETLHQMALEAGCKSTHYAIDLPFGHDSFLLDGDLQGAALRDFLASR